MRKRFSYNRDLCKRFISDYKLPIPLLDSEHFFYHIGIYEKDFRSSTKYNRLVRLIEDKYVGNPEAFLKDYYDIRENIIQTVTNSEAFQKFNNMDMNKFAITERPNISSNNIYNQDNIGHFFISVDLKKANFQVLRNIDKNIVFGADTYEDFIGNFTELEYVKESKYTREVIFGKMNPKRHITAEKYFITKIYKLLVNALPELEDRAISLSNDEIIFKFDDMYKIASNKGIKVETYADNLREKIRGLSLGVGFDVHVDFFRLEGYSLNAVTQEGEKPFKTFYMKSYFFGEDKFKLISLPLQFHSVTYCLLNNVTPYAIDYDFEYEGIIASFKTDFKVVKIN